MKTLIFSLFLFLSFSVFAQNSGFKVLLTEGTHTFGQNEFITIGSEIPENQTIKFEGEYLAMMDSEGKTIELTEKGVYSMKDLKEKKSSKSWDYLKKLDWVKCLVLMNNTYYKKLTGSVLCQNPPNQVTILLPTRQTTYNNKIWLNWYWTGHISYYPSNTKRHTKGFKIYLCNLKDEILLEFPLTEQYEFQFDFDNPILEKEIMIIVKVIAIDTEGESFQEHITMGGKVIERLDSIDHQAITKEISQLQNPDCPILSQLVLANYFEEKDMLIDARLTYMKLLEMKNLALFRTLYQNFLYRNQMIKEAFFRD